MSEEQNRIALTLQVDRQVQCIAPLDKAEDIAQKQNRYLRLIQSDTQSIKLTDSIKQRFSNRKQATYHKRSTKYFKRSNCNSQSK